MTRTAVVLMTLVVVAGAVACGGASETQRPPEVPPGQDRAGGLDAERPEDDQGRCDADQPGREVSEYDTSGDDWPDVRKVFLSVGVGRLARLILICREADLNGDGIKDVVRYYTDEGRPRREEADRDFDGKMDEITIFDDGWIIRQELDTNGDSRVDAKIFFDSGKPLRAERDLSGRSTATEWKPDRWEYYDDGRVVRMGTDLDGDGIVDRWDRNEEAQRAQQNESSSEQSDDVDDGGEG